jgi:small-conductance mechanosensitive channel
MKKTEREEEARAALKRLDQQSEKILGAQPIEEPANDRIEILGKRIARILSMIILVGLVVYLWRTYLSG